MSPYLSLAVMVLLAGSILILLYRSACRKTLYGVKNIASAASFLPLAVFLAELGINAWNGTPLWRFLTQFPMHFAHFSAIGLFLLMVGMAVSNVELIRREGRALKNIVGTLMEFSLLCGTLALYALMQWIEHHAAPSFLHSFLPMTLYILLDYVECILFGIMWMGYVAAHQKPAYDKDFIIIPGCSISKTGGLLPLLRGRVNRAMRYAWEQEASSGKKLRYVPSGGQGADEIISEGSAMAFYLLTHSAEEDEVFPEKESVNTRENFALSKKRIDSLFPDAKVAFSTTNYHMLRCGMLARSLGMDAEGIASSTKWYFWPNGFAREAVAILVMTKKYHLAALPVLLAASAVLSAISYFWL